MAVDAADVVGSFSASIQMPMPLLGCRCCWLHGAPAPAVVLAVPFWVAWTLSEWIVGMGMGARVCVSR